MVNVGIEKLAYQMERSAVVRLVDNTVERPMTISAHTILESLKWTYTPRGDITQPVAPN
jgi:hypothetical protein